MPEERQQDIIISGVGGQGILTVAGVLCAAAVAEGLRVKQSEVHGMAQRGGAVITHLRVSSKSIHSDLVPHGSAHLVIALEPMEGLRYLPHARSDALLIVNKSPVSNIAAYPDIEKVIRRIEEWKQHVLVDAEQLAKDAGTVRAVNSVMLGAASEYLVLTSERLRQTVGEYFEKKGPAVVEKNLAAFDLGREAAWQGE